MSDYQNDFDNLFPAEPAALSRADVRQEVSQVLQDISEFSTKAAAGRQRALEQVSKQYPDFQRLAGSPDEVRRLFEQEPLLAQAVVSAENNPNLADTLPQLYSISYKVWKAGGAGRPVYASRTSEESPVETPRLMNEETIFESTEASKRVDLSPENRKSLIDQLEERGILDVAF
jgi:hypothetical protein